jgi:hypothetical protein
MQSLWQWFIGILVWLSADPDAITTETPKAAAAVAVAYAALTPEPSPTTPPKPVGPVNAAPCINGNCPTIR